VLPTPGIFFAVGPLGLGQSKDGTRARNIAVVHLRDESHVAVWVESVFGDLSEQENESPRYRIRSVAEIRALELGRSVVAHECNSTASASGQR
jgi:hypothetical protein